MVNPHELTDDPAEVWFSWELDGAGVPRPTLWDTEPEGVDATRAVVLITDNGVTITTEEESVRAFLDGEE